MKRELFVVSSIKGAVIPTRNWLVKPPLKPSIQLNAFRIPITQKIVNKRSPLTSDRSHIHHALDRLGLKGLRVSFVVLVISSMLALTGVTLELIDVPELVSVLLLVFVSLVFLRYRFNLENS